MAWLVFCISQVAFASETIYLSPPEFLAASLPGCEPKTLWLKKEVKQAIEEMLERPFSGARVRYCLKDGKTGWILDEIGKTEPITSGIIIDQGRVEEVRVLIFRESRGSEVHRGIFVAQYADASLNGDNKLDRRIDGITGATLSVWALNRQVKLALLLDGIARESFDDG